MNAKVEQPAPAANGGDLMKYALAFFLVAGGIAAFYLVGQWPAPLRGLVIVAAVAAALAVAAFTAKGRQTRTYLAESRFELRKVVWPTHQETRKATLVIMVVVVVISLLLGLIDLTISQGVKWLLGH